MRFQPDSLENLKMQNIDLFVDRTSLFTISKYKISVNYPLVGTLLPEFSLGLKAIF